MNMWLFAYSLVISIGFILTEEPTTKQVNTTNTATHTSKRYSIRTPQYNSLQYTNSQAPPNQQLLFDNTQSLINYINNLQGKPAPYGIAPNYYFLNNNIAPPYAVQNVVPQIQKNVIFTAPQGPFLQRLLQQEVVPQQLIQQQVPPQPTLQNVVPQLQSAQEVSSQQFLQGIVPQQLPQRVIQVRPQVIPTQLFRPEVVPHQAPLQRIVPQGIVQQQLLPQLLTQQVIPQRLITPQVIPQRIIPQQSVPSKVIPQQIITQRIQNIPPQQPPSQNNILPLLVRQQILPFPFPNAVPIQFQYPFYRAEPPRPQVSVDKEPYPYEIPPGQTKLPVNAGIHARIHVNPAAPPQNGAPQNPFGAPPGQTKLAINTPPSHQLPQNLIYNPAYGQQQQINAQPLYVNPYIQSTTGNGQQVVRIGYGHPHQIHQEVVQNTHPHNRHHTIYIHPNVNAQQEVRIGYGHLHLGHEESANGPQQIKLEIPLAYSGVGDNRNEGIAYYYQNSARPARTVKGSENSKMKLNEAEQVKS